MALTPLLLALAAAAGNLIGAVLLVRRARGGVRAVETSLAFGAGFMLAVVLTGILPTVFEVGGPTPGWTVSSGTLPCTSPTTSWCRTSTLVRRPTRSPKMSG